MTHSTEILRPRQAAEYLGAGLSTLYRWAQTRPDFPKKLRLGPRTVGYRRSDLDKWLESREVV